MFEIGLHHFLIVSILLASAGIATLLTKRNAIGILIGVELILNAASVNLVAFNRYAHPQAVVTHQVTAAQVQQIEQELRPRHPEATDEALILRVIRQTRPHAQPVMPLEADLFIPGAQIPVSVPAVAGIVFAIFIIVLAAAEAAIALAIILNFYNNFSSVDVERADELRG